MNYIIKGLEPERFAYIHNMSDGQLAQNRIMPMRATSFPGFPCRVSLEDTPVGEQVFLMNYTSHEVAGPFASSYAIYIRPGVKRAAVYRNEIPPVFKHRTLSYRGFSQDGMLQSAKLVEPGAANIAIHKMFAHSDIAYIDAHNAAPGCFSARILRDQ